MRAQHFVCATRLLHKRRLPLGRQLQRVGENGLGLPGFHHVKTIPTARVRPQSNHPRGGLDLAG
jgi:hypothetical protein